MALTPVLPVQQENIMKSNIDKKFSAHYDAVEAELKSSTVGEQRARPPPSLGSRGLPLPWHWAADPHPRLSSPLGLVTLNDMKAKQEALVKEREKQLAKKEQSKELQLWVLSSQPAAPPPQPPTPTPTCS